jgi:glycosyltransferase involved in cell wall biosynthesis
MTTSMRYVVILPTLNGSATIQKALDSILNQTVPPACISVVDGGSTDGNFELLQRYYVRQRYKKRRRFLLQRTHLKDKHSIVIVHHYNQAIAEAGTDFDYWFFHADDCVFPPSYVEDLAAAMERDRVDVGSGDWREASRFDLQKAPTGAGRLVSRRMMATMNWRFPEMYGYESYVLSKAEQVGYKCRCYSGVRFELLTKFGVEAWHPLPEDGVGEGHNFYEWGYGMRCLGYTPAYVLLRMVHDFLWNTLIPKRAALKMAYDYFSTYWRKTEDPYCRPIQDEAYMRFMARKHNAVVISVLLYPIRLLRNFAVRIYRLLRRRPRVEN